MRQREKRKVKSVGSRVGTLNVGMTTGKGREMADMIRRRKVLCVCKRPGGKGRKARSSGAAGFKLYYHVVDRKRNGAGIILE